MSERCSAPFSIREAVTVISALGVLACLALPFMQHKCVLTSQSIALQSSRGIYAALRLYSGDHDGRFPAAVDEDYDGPHGPVRDANLAYANLVPTYMSDEKPFQVPESAWCKDAKGATVQITNDFSSRDVVLTKGMNHFAYVSGLTEKSNPAFPLIADGFAGASGPVSSPHYARDPRQRGGAWKDQRAIVVRCDGSAKLEKFDGKTGIVYAEINKHTANLFVPRAAWIERCTVLNPR